MPQPIERLGHMVDDAGFIHYDERPVGWDRVDQIAGRHLDRRKRYAVIGGEVCSVASWTSRCSGCSNGHEGRGFGCHECGYQGVVRQAQWVPESATPQEA